MPYAKPPIPSWQKNDWAITAHRSLFHRILLLSTLTTSRHKKHSARRIAPEQAASTAILFFDPDIINKNAAYAPFFTRWDDYYQRYYFDQGARNSNRRKILMNG
jgi:hypothetical protein